ncbi:MAG: FHA domain-containing protein [Steroidobacteraceae bacterium]
MNTELDTDLDTTAELPQLSLQTSGLRRVVHSGEELQDESFPAIAKEFSDTAGTDSWPQVSGDSLTDTANWSMVDELLTVRDKIVDLEAALLESELKFAKLDKAHQELLSNHVELGARNAEMIRDRERLDAERELLLTSRQQLNEQLQCQQAEAAANELTAQQQIEQQRQQMKAVAAERATDFERHQSEMAQHRQTMQQLSNTLLAEQERIQSLQVDLRQTGVAQATQQAAAAALARNLSHELLAKEALQANVTLREQRIQKLELAKQNLEVQLADAETQHRAALTLADELRDELQSKDQQLAELHGTLGVTEERTVGLSDQLEMERSRWRAAEQDKERLTRLVSAEHQSYESTRKELSWRLTELSAVQDQLADVRAELVNLGTQLANREMELHSRDALLAAQQQDLQSANDTHATALAHAAAMEAMLKATQEELNQTQDGLMERANLLRTIEQQLLVEQQSRQQASAQLELLQKQMQQLEAQKYERGQFILEQASEVEQLQHATAELESQLKRAESLNETQQFTIQALEVELMPLRAQREQQAQLLAQLQQELAERRKEQGANAKQVQDLQHELHQHVETLNAIRRDIHQVAQPSGYRDAELLVRTLTRLDDSSVVHLLNKAVLAIGRAGDADICIRAESISRRHACLRVGRDVVIIEDLGSTNGCYVNGKRIKRQLLKDGDQLEIGEVKFRFGERATQS